MLSDAVRRSGSDVQPARRVCRFCGQPLHRLIVDLGMSPLCESFLRRRPARRDGAVLPAARAGLRACLLVQLRRVRRPEEIFTRVRLLLVLLGLVVGRTPRGYADACIDRLGLADGSLVIELAQQRRLPAAALRRSAGSRSLGHRAGARTSPTRRASEGIPTDHRVLRAATWRGELRASRARADLVVGNNVLAQVPDLNDFVPGSRSSSGPMGVLTIEFPHLLRLMEGNQFDTIYHEHFSYFSLLPSARSSRATASTVFDVEELPTHGGSLRIYARHAASPRRRARAGGRGGAAREDARPAWTTLGRVRGVREPGRGDEARRCWRS